MTFDRIGTFSEVHGLRGRARAITVRVARAAITGGDPDRDRRPRRGHRPERTRAHVWFELPTVASIPEKPISINLG
jgi:hypothetical protein